MDFHGGLASSASNFWYFVKTWPSIVNEEEPEPVTTQQTLTRVELTDAIVREVGLTRQESSDLLDRMLELVSSSLEHEGLVKLSRFGNFQVRRKAAREGRNPKTGVEATISARRVVTFKPSPALKSKVDGN